MAVLLTGKASAGKREVAEEDAVGTAPRVFSCLSCTAFAAIAGVGRLGTREHAQRSAALAKELWTRGWKAPTPFDTVYPFADRFSRVCVPGHPCSRSPAGRLGKIAAFCFFDVASD